MAAMAAAASASLAHRAVVGRPASSAPAAKARAAVAAPSSWLKERAVSLRPSAPAACNRALSSSRRVVVRSEYALKKVGEFETLDYRIFFIDDSGNTVSPWHDIPLRAGEGLFNMVCEIPKETKAKMEVATDEPNTPIKQDTKKGNIRYYPYNINWNYGMIPQTWEDPSHSNPDVENAAGDNDPVDVVEIGERAAGMGEVYAVKPLAVLALVDDGELDWKIIVIRADDPKAPLVDNMADVEREFPGTLTAIRDWFRDYKIPDGKPPNKFGFDSKPVDKEYALKVIEETNRFWLQLVQRVTPRGDLSLV